MIKIQFETIGEVVEQKMNLNKATETEIAVTIAHIEMMKSYLVTELANLVDVVKGESL